MLRREEPFGSKNNYSSSFLRSAILFCGRLATVAQHRFQLQQPHQALGPVLVTEWVLRPCYGTFGARKEESVGGWDDKPWGYS